MEGFKLHLALVREIETELKFCVLNYWKDLLVQVFHGDTLSVIVRGVELENGRRAFSVSCYKVEDGEPVQLVCNITTQSDSKDDLRIACDDALGQYEEFCKKKEKNKAKRKYRRGGHIISLDELARQEFVYWHDKITHCGWFMSWQFRMAANNVGENGCIYYAIKEE